MKVENFKPNLIPNNKKDGSTDLNSIIEKAGGISEYLVTLKKDGCRLQLGIANHALTRSLKRPQSILVQKRFDPINKVCKKLKITIDGEFYQHGMKFNQIYSYFSNTDVTSEEYKKKLKKAQLKNPEEFEKKYEGRSIEELTTFQDKLAFWMFDGTVIDRPDLIGYAERMNEIAARIQKYEASHGTLWDLTNPYFLKVDNTEQLHNLFESALDNGYEGLVLTHKDHEYKYGRTSLSKGTILKMKNDALEYDGVILDVVEGTVVKGGVAKTRNELGGSQTSQKKEDRESSGKAKGFLVEYEDKGTFVVGLNGFDDADKMGLLNNKEIYIGKHFTYTGMEPVKDFPRHAFFKNWRDAK